MKESLRKCGKGISFFASAALALGQPVGPEVSGAQHPLPTPICANYPDYWNRGDAAGWVPSLGEDQTAGPDRSSEMYRRGVNGRVVDARWELVGDRRMLRVLLELGLSRPLPAPEQFVVFAGGAGASGPVGSVALGGNNPNPCQTEILFRVPRGTIESGATVKIFNVFGLMETEIAVQLPDNPPADGEDNPYKVYLPVVANQSEALEEWARQTGIHLPYLSGGSSRGTDGER